jgi:hypothetical protein
MIFQMNEYLQIMFISSEYRYLIISVSCQESVLRTTNWIIMISGDQNSNRKNIDLAQS